MSMRRSLWYGLAALAVFLLVLPAAVRVLSGRPVIAGGEPYGHLRIAEIIAEDGIPGFDPSVPERKYRAGIFDLVLAGFVAVFGGFGALVLPFLLGLLAVACLWMALRRWKMGRMLVFCVMLVFVVSPAFVSVFAQSTPRALELFLISALFLALAPGKTGGIAALLRAVAAIGVAMALASMGVVQALAAVALPLLLRASSRRSSQWYLLVSGAALLVLVGVSLPAFLQAERALFDRPMPVVLAIADFGSSAGLSVFAWLLAGIGLVRCWRWKAEYYAGLVAAIAVLFAALFIPSALVVAHVVVSFLAGYALCFFVMREWSFGDIRTMTLLVLLCGLLFSTLSQGLSLAKGGPTGGMRDAALAIRGQVPDGTRLLALPQDGFWLAYWSGVPVLMDGWTAQTPQVNERWALAQAVWRSNDVMKLRPVLLKNRIGGIVVTGEMRQGLVWDLPEEGVLGLVRNSETFKNVHRSSSVEVWAVLPAE